MSKISILVPVYFNETNLRVTIPILQNILNSLTDMEGELVIVDDHSEDRSFEILREFATQDQRLKLIRLAKNFGAHTALLAGLDYTTGDCLVIIMADLQDPPELIPEMIQKWRDGNKIVIAARTDREDRWIDRVFASFFWRFMRRFAIPSIPKGGFDFVLFDRAVRDILVQMREKNSHLMTQILWTGFSTATIPYTRQKRKFGKSKWTLSKKIKLFIDSAIAFSYVPVRFMSILGVSTAFLGFLYAAYVLILRLITGSPVQGWTSLMIVALLIGGMQMAMLGVIGEYLWRTYDEARHRPSYIIAEKHNL